MKPFILNSSPLNPGRDPQKGQALVEFAFVIPVVFLFFFAFVEIGNMVIQREKEMAFSRDITNIVFRDCSALVQSTTLVDDCLAGISGKVNQIIDATFPSFRTQGAILMNFYRYNPDTKASFQFQRFLFGGGFNSRYTLDATGQDIMQRAQRMVVGEIFYNYTSITPFVSFLKFFNLTNLFPQVIYDLAIF